MSGFVETQTAKAWRALMIFSVGSSVLVFGGTILIVFFINAQAESIRVPVSLKYIIDTIVFFSTPLAFIILPIMAIVALFFTYFRPLRRLETYVLVCFVAPTINTLTISILLGWPVSFWKIFDIFGKHIIACLTLGIVVVPLIWSLTSRWHHAKIVPIVKLDRAEGVGEVT